MSTALQGFLLVVDRSEGPVYYGSWRDSRGRQVKRRLGPTWLERKAAGERRKRRGRCQDGYLEERAAHVALRATIDAHEKDLQLEARAPKRRGEGKPCRASR